METAERAVQAEALRQRRVGTFTLGLVLVATGCGMLASMFWPGFRPEWLLSVSPCILILLGVETLLSARGGGRVKYDWLGMLLCFILTGTALCMYGAAWWFANSEAEGCRTRQASQDVYLMDYSYFNGVDSHTLYLEAGDVLQGWVNTYNGWLEVEISDGDGNAVCEASPMNGEQRIEISKDGDYTILVWGRRTSGSFAFSRVPAGEENPPELPAA